MEWELYCCLLFPERTPKALCLADVNTNEVGFKGMSRAENDTSPTAQKFFFSGTNTASGVVLKGSYKSGVRVLGNVYHRRKLMAHGMVARQESQCSMGPLT